MAQAGIGNLAGGMGKFTELRQRLLFVVGALIVYRIGCYVPVPGVNPDAMLAMMQQQGGGIVDMFNIINRFNVADVNVLYTNAGQPTSAFDPRQFQFALKLNF